MVNVTVIVVIIIIIIIIIITKYSQQCKILFLTFPLVVRTNIIVSYAYWHEVTVRLQLHRLLLAEFALYTSKVNCIYSYIHTYIHTLHGVLESKGF
jgi:predicted membrane protein